MFYFYTRTKKFIKQDLINDKCIVNDKCIASTKNIKIVLK